MKRTQIFQRNSHTSERRLQAAEASPTQRSQHICTPKRSSAFTLIEMLMVIAVIGILAGLLVNLAGWAGKSKKEALVKAEKEKLMTIIESYHEKLGFYPPDGVRNNDQSTANTNQLFYELTGCNYDTTVTPAEFHAINADNSVITVNDVALYIGKGGIANSAQAPNQAQNFYRPAPVAKDYKPNPDTGSKIMQFVVPVGLDSLAPGKPNFWYYDSTSTNRHNPDSYDLWAVFSVGKETVTNGNWTQQ